MLEVQFIDSEKKTYEISGKIRFGSKSLNFTSFVGKKYQLVILDYDKINSFTILKG